MRSSIALSVAALAGSAIAAPQWGQYKQVKNVHLVVQTVVHTVYVTEGGYQAHKPTEAPVVTATVVYEPEPEPTTTPVYEAPTSTVVYEPEPEAPATSAAPAPAPAPSGDDYMAIVDEWRGKLGLAKLARDSKLESNAMNCVVEGNGAMKHKLNPGTFGQVLAPGKDTQESFLSVFVGGWLCELPNTPGLEGVCGTMSKGWSYEGQTGHAEILMSDNYSKIGCAYYDGIHGCDLA